MYCQNGILFSNKNYELSFNVEKVIKGKKVYLTYSKDYEDCISKITTYKPTFLIVDIDTIKLPHEVLKTFANQGVYNLSCVFFFSTTSKSEIDGVINLSYSNLGDILSIPDRINMDYLNLKKDEEFSKKVTQLLICYGFSTSHLGFAYLKEILFNLLGDSANFKSLNGYVYPKIANQYSTSVPSIERNIRNAIIKAYKIQKEAMDQVFHKNKKPSTREILFYFKDLLSVDVA